MAATDEAGGGSRRFVTRTHIEDARAEGVVRLGPRDVVTDAARQRAEDLGVRIERAGASSALTSGGAPMSPPRPGSSAQTATSAPTPPTPAVTATATVDPDVLRKAVRSAVVAELGNEPAGLDGAIDRVLARRER